MMLSLGIDVGGSAARWALLSDQGDLVARGATEGFSGHMLDDVVRSRAEAAIAVLSGEVLQHGAVNAIHAGVTGLSAATAEAEWVARRLADATRCDIARIAIEDDVSLAYRACFRPGEGVLVYAGTGSFALHMTRSGERWRAGGHGVLIDDEGGAAWIAREALRQLLAQDDAKPGSGWNSPLGRSFGERFGGADWPHARAFVYGAHRGAIGQLARAVADAAAESDAIAIAVLRQAGAALGGLAKTLRARTGLLPVSATGGALRLSPLIGETFLTSAHSAAPARIVEIDAALTAARLALDAQRKPV
ncbi:N-acetylglucosamine kinase [Terrarubrum flagellatum]|uniref:N-acetylglucosamine kinase n=1 Tax=Terrirubrum flagellatum TaxID=2895980 RepID=UPI0031452555